MILHYPPMVWLPLMWLMANPDPGCIVVERSQIHAGDLAQRIDAFASLPSLTVLATSPSFGARRDLAAATLRQWAAQHEVLLESPHPICIYRRPARSEDIAWEAELRLALDSLFQFRPGPGELSILETQLTPGAPGKLNLERGGLNYDPVRKSYLWRGKLVGEGLHASARIRFAISSTEQRIVTAKPIPAGRVLAADDFAVLILPVRPELPRTEVLGQLPVGQVLRRSLPRGTLVQNQHLMDAPIIFAGEMVELLSRAGQAVIRTQGYARNKARMGDPVVVSALETRRLVRAIAIGPGLVEIQASKGKPSP